MALVRFEMTQPHPVDGQAPAGGIFTCRPDRRRIDGAHVVRPEGVEAQLVNGVATAELDPTDDTWCWEIMEPGDETVRYFAVPDVETIDYVALVQVDPATLAPTGTAPSAAWQIALDAALARIEILEAGGGGSGTVVDASTSAKGIVELATSAEGISGTSDSLAMTPAATKSAIDNRGYATTTQLSDGLAGKAGTGHGHAISDIADLADELDGKQPAGSYAPATHSHALDGLTDVDLDTDAPTNGQALTWDETTEKWIPRSVLTGVDASMMPAQTVMYVAGPSTAARPTARTDVLVLWFTTDATIPANKTGDDIWMNGPA